jgi:hypothetical protein
MASHDNEDAMPEETQGYKLSQPKQSLAEYKNMGGHNFQPKKTPNARITRANSPASQTRTTSPCSATKNPSA